MLIRVSFSVALIAAMSCVQAEDSVPGPTNTIPQGKSAIVVFRPLDSVPAKSVNVYINGEYLSSLRAGTYAEVTVCPGENRISVETSDVRNRYAEKREPGERVQQTSDTVSYFEIDSKNGGLISIPLDDVQAAQRLSAMPQKQRHTISRVSQRSCDLK